MMVGRAITSGTGRYPCFAVVRGRAVVPRIGEDFGSGEFRL
jgi:hypothetical protein